LHDIADVFSCKLRQCTRALVDNNPVGQLIIGEKSRRQFLVAAIKNWIQAKKINGAIQSKQDDFEK
jgi:hypothetical protein